MRLLTTFMDEQVHSKDPPSPWVMVTPSWCFEAAEEEALESMREWSSKCWRAQPWGSFSTIPFLGCSKCLVVPSTTTSSIPTSPGQQTCAPNIFMQWVKMPPGSLSEWKQMWLPRFAKIAKSLWGDKPPHITIDLPPVLTTSPGLLAGTSMTTMMSVWVWQDATTGTTYVETVMASMSLVSLGLTPMAVDHLMATLEDVTEQESEDLVQTQPYAPNVISINAIFPQQWQLSTLTLYRTVFLRCSHPVLTVNMFWL